jgi:hypothetical protein
VTFNHGVEGSSPSALTIENPCYIRLTCISTGSKCYLKKATNNRNWGWVGLVFGGGQPQIASSGTSQTLPRSSSASRLCRRSGWPVDDRCPGWQNALYGFLTGGTLIVAPVDI